MTVPPDLLYYPSRKLVPDEVFDLVTGRLLAPGERSHGTIRYTVKEKRQCMMCDRTIRPGEEVEEDLVLLCVEPCFKRVMEEDSYHYQEAQI